MGRKRKFGRRKPSGDIIDNKRPDDRVRASRQPHRRTLPRDDRMSEKAESPLGRMNLRGIISDEQHEAGLRYAQLVGAYRSIIGGPRYVAGSGRGASCNASCGDRKVCDCFKLCERYNGAYCALFGAGQRAARTVARVAVYREEAWADEVAYLTIGLSALVAHFGLQVSAERMRARSE